MPTSFYAAPENRVPERPSPSSSEAETAVKRSATHEVDADPEPTHTRVSDEDVVGTSSAPATPSPPPPSTPTPPSPSSDDELEGRPVAQRILVALQAAPALETVATVAVAERLEGYLAQLGAPVSAAVEAIRDLDADVGAEFAVGDYSRRNALPGLLMRWTRAQSARVKQARIAGPGKRPSLAPADRQRAEREHQAKIARDARERRAQLASESETAAGPRALASILRGVQAAVVGEVGS